MEITDPSEESNLRMLMSSSAGEGSVLEVTRGDDAGPVFFLDMVGRTLASVDDIEERTYVMTRPQVKYLVGLLITALDGH